MRTKFWIKERHNPQLGVYYVRCGQMTKSDAKRAERSIYGVNVMHSFDTAGEYEARIADLEKQNHRVL